MHPKSEALGDVRDGGNRVDAAGGCGPDRGNYAERAQAGRPVALDSFDQRAGSHAKFRVGGNLPHVLQADSDGDGALLNRVVRVLGSVENQIAGPAMISDI